MQVTAVKCGKCDELLAEASNTPIAQRAPCPKCGSTSRQFAVSGTARVTASASLAWEHHHEFYERHRGWMAFAIILTVAGSLVGLVLTGWPGVLVGLGIGAAAYLIAPYATVKVRNITRGGAS
jgi:phage FluMu protein Com